MHLRIRRPLLTVAIINLFFLLSCASTPPAQVDPDELEMLAEIQRERGERSAQVASKLLQQAKLIQQKVGMQKAFEYLMDMGTRYPYEAMKIRETLFGEHAQARADRVTEETPPLPRARIFTVC